jgi:F0F1-type ATP synthase beta subunit
LNLAAVGAGVGKKMLLEKIITEIITKFEGSNGFYGKK